MANTLTNLIPTIYAAKDIVLKELTGFIPAVTLDASGEQAAKDQTIRWPVVAAETAADIAPAATGPDPADTSVGNDTMTISKSKSSTFYWTGEDQKGLGGLYGQILQDQFAQAMRVLVNEVEADLAALYKTASRAYGTAGTTPFGTAGDFAALAELRKILADNGAPISDLQVVMNTTAGAKLRSQASLQSASAYGSDALLRRGVLLDMFGFALRESAGVKAHTKGTGASYVTSGSTAAGVTDIALVTGTGTVLAGDVVTFAADTANKYVVTTGVAAPGTISLAKPGALVTIATANAMTIGANYTANLGFSRSAIALMMRAPAMPEGGDAADDVTVITDETTGISFQVAMYRQYRRVAYEVGLAWGVKAVKPEAIAILLG
ncbi:MAG: P22 phage major capsid protein family protein [Anaerolineae bacterium]